MVIVSGRGARNLAVYGTANFTVPSGFGLPVDGIG
jgi:hypothetical protein